MHRAIDVGFLAWITSTHASGNDRGCPWLRRLTVRGDKGFIDQCVKSLSIAQSVILVGLCKGVVSFQSVNEF